MFCNKNYKKLRFCKLDFGNMRMWNMQIDVDCSKENIATQMLHVFK